MSTLDTPVVRQATGWYQASLDEWNGLVPRTQVRAKVVVLVAVTVIAYHYSLYSLVQTIGLDTPLAYVGLVPLIAGGLALFNRYPRRSRAPDQRPAAGLHAGYAAGGRGRTGRTRAAVAAGGHVLGEPDRPPRSSPCSSPGR